MNFGDFGSLERLFWNVAPFWLCCGSAWWGSNDRVAHSGNRNRATGTGRPELGDRNWCPTHGPGSISFASGAGRIVSERVNHRHGQTRTRTGWARNLFQQSTKTVFRTQLLGHFVWYRYGKLGIVVGACSALEKPTKKPFLYRRFL